MAAAPELLPEAISLADALPLLGELAAFLFVVGVIYVVDAFVRALFGTVSGVIGWIPYLGKVTSAPLHSIERKITSSLGSAEASFDHRIGMSLHKLARIGDQIGRELYGLATLLFLVSKIVTTGLTWKDLQHIYRIVKSDATAAARTAEHLLHRVGINEKLFASAIPANVLPRLGRIEHELDHVFEPDLAHLRKRVGKLEDGAIDAFKWIKAHPLSLGATAFAAAVAIALQRLGGSWIRCRNWNRIGKHVCGLPASLIEDLLAASIVAMVATDICDFANAVETIALQVEPALIALVDVENALVGCHGATAPPDLTLPGLTLPPNSLGLPLAA